MGKTLNDSTTQTIIYLHNTLPINWQSQKYSNGGLTSINQTQLRILLKAKQFVYLKAKSQFANVQLIQKSILFFISEGKLHAKPSQQFELNSTVRPICILAAFTHYTTYMRFQRQQISFNIKHI
ncbi:unnamed protein product [Schistosoma bovis]|nr:unnamed protein product [Schistosoma bovis]CAH8536702.1 unnamed protein product [Schistosoma bovis]